MIGHHSIQSYAQIIPESLWQGPGVRALSPTWQAGTCTLSTAAVAILQVSTQPLPTPPHAYLPEPRTGVIMKAPCAGRTACIALSLRPVCNITTVVLGFLFLVAGDPRSRDPGHI